MGLPLTRLHPGMWWTFRELHRQIDIAEVARTLPGNAKTLVVFLVHSVRRLTANISF